jgi:hypothetical protein
MLADQYHLIQEYSRAPVPIKYTKSMPIKIISSRYGGACIHSCAQEAEMGASCVQGQPGLHSEFEANLNYLETPCLKKKKNPQKQKKDILLVGIENQCFVQVKIHFLQNCTLKCI